MFLILVVIIFTKLLASNGVIYAQPVADIISTLITIPLAIKFKNDLKIKGNYSAMKPVEDQKVIQQR
ncbi:sodium transporter [Clostridium botulinum]|uniref:sodium transporter n=1 Tax=Clostridium botulinum TaxID=1491 RepID=UPI00196A157D|nr:sodium transporter [Clostridium botulinum]MBY6873223.1 sodium transporter [Clostridium botulinum]MBY6888443.1 sodium transporter [Clostridium botulinum]HBJ2608577.1 sodium transporter [Clostridium botulinum]HDI3056887.1 sodium transporter [Clostridium botulinum]HDI3119288.1 sodium transporter [Clostridium botulinum]